VVGAKWLKFYATYTFSTSPNLCHRTTISVILPSSYHNLLNWWKFDKVLTKTKMLLFSETRWIQGGLNYTRPTVILACNNWMNWSSNNFCHIQITNYIKQQVAKCQFYVNESVRRYRGHHVWSRLIICKEIVLSVGLTLENISTQRMQSLHSVTTIILQYRQ